MKHTYDFSKYIAVTNRQLAGSDDSYFSQIEKIAALEPHAVILREKELNREEYAVFAARVKKICDKYGVTLFAVNTFIYPSQIFAAIRKNMKMTIQIYMIQIIFWHISLKSACRAIV